MTSRTKASEPKPEAGGQAEAETTSPEPAESQPEVEAPVCGKPHHLPMLAGHVACQLPPEGPDREPGAPEHEHRHEDGDAIYVWS